jgi:hypothetical protein
MSVDLYAVSVLSCVGSGLATGLIPRPKGPTDRQSISFTISELIPNGNMPEGIIRQGERKRKRKGKVKLSLCLVK